MFTRIKLFITTHNKTILLALHKEYRLLVKVHLWHLQVCQVVLKKRGYVKELTELRSTEQKVQDTVANTNVLEKLISLPQPTTFDAASLIESAKRIGEEQSRLLTQKKLLTQEVQLKQQRFRKQAPTKQALESSQVCKEEMELTIPYGYVSFSTRYEADIEREK